MKSTVAALTIVVSLLAIAPTAAAASYKGTRQTASSAREIGREKDRGPVVKLIQRALRRIGINSGPQVPIPAPSDQSE